MESSFEKLMRIGESIALVHADPGKRKAEEMEEPEERCLDQYFDGRAKGVGQEDLESHCVEILNNPGLYCCLNHWFTNGSSKFEDPITLEEIYYGETGYFVKGKIYVDENGENQIEKIPVQVAITYPGLHRWNLESLEEQIKRRGWKDQYNGPIDFYMIITSAKRTQIDSGTGLPSVTDNQDSRGTYTFDGILKSRNGHTVKGRFENLHKENKKILFDCKDCELTSRNGTIYKGEFKQGSINGQATTTFPGGDVYEGEFKNNMANGRGTFMYSNGDVYIGEFQNGKPGGQGTMTYEDGGTYTGNWEKGRKNGQGTLKYPSGQTYTGEWNNDRKNGQGTMTYKNGDVYTGEWENGNPKKN